MEKRIKTVMLSHGSGGRLTHELIKEVFAAKFSNPVLDAMDDAARLARPKGCVAFTTDSYVVTPLEFPGGDIGRISVCGTINDLAMKGANAAGISASFIIEEGLEFSVLERIVASMRRAADEAGVKIVTGDTKVVEKGKADRLFITTSGIGVIPDKVSISGSNAGPGDAVIVSGNLAEHGVAVMNARNNLGLEGGIKSDGAPLNGLVEAMLRVSKNIRVMRDLTRGGLATALNEIASASGCSIEIEEERVPVSAGVGAACDLLGLDPLYVANEGKLVAFVPQKDAGKVLAAMRKQRYGKNAVIAGRVLKGPAKVSLNTRVGGSRTLLMLEGEQLPRIC
ncbi:MAG: hydrogenase expression/formation protein HypE [bacterium]